MWLKLEQFSALLESVHQALGLVLLPGRFPHSIVLPLTFVAALGFKRCPNPGFWSERAVVVVVPAGLRNRQLSPLYFFPDVSESRCSLVPAPPFLEQKLLNYRSASLKMGKPAPPLVFIPLL